MTRDLERQKATQKRWNDSHPELVRAYKKRYDDKHKKEKAESSKKWWVKNRARKMPHYRKTYRKKHPDRRVSEHIENQRRLRLRCLNYLGGAVCVMCGFSDIRALVIDHINNDGNKERYGFLAKRGRQYFAYICRMPQEEARQRYQVLCANCNMIKESNVRLAKANERIEKLKLQANNNSISATSPAS